MMAVGDAHVFPGFLTTLFPKPPTTFLSCFYRGEWRKYAGKKARLNRGSNSQQPGHEFDTLTTEPPVRGPKLSVCLANQSNGHRFLPPPLFFSLFLSHNISCFQYDIDITNFLVSHTCGIRFYGVRGRNNVYMYSYAKIPKLG